jgi:hypothetical protein
VSDALKKLTLVCPTMTAEQIIEHLIEADNLAAGFTTSPVNGHGHDFETASVSERVRGHVRRTAITLVAGSNEVAELLSQLREKFPSPHVVYWTEPVGEFGDFS